MANRLNEAPKRRNPLYKLYGGAVPLVTRKPVAWRTSSFSFFFWLNAKWDQLFAGIRRAWLVTKGPETVSRGKLAGWKGGGREKAGVIWNVGLNGALRIGFTHPMTL